MPFVMRKVEPRLLCRGHVPPGPQPEVGAELDSVAHGALTGCLKQLASLLTLAEDIFAELTSELTTIADRSGALRQRVDRVDERLGTIDPKKIPVPESDISTFASRKDHFHADNHPNVTLFTVDTRPRILKELYDAAAIVAVKSLDSISRFEDGRNNSTDMYLCTPVLGKRRRDESLDIESRVPAVIEDLRRWTSTEALGDVTVPPDCMSRIFTDATDDVAVDHKLPSPEEQVQAVALKFPAEIVAVDVSGRGFERMSIRRRSLLSPGGQEHHEVSVKRRSRPRRPRGKRRNTIAGIDQKEIRQAIGGETTTEDLEEAAASPSAGSRAVRSASTDILGSKKDSPPEKKSHFNTLKAWGMSRLKLISPKSSQSVQDSGNGSNNAGDEQSGVDEKQTVSPEEANIYETVTMRRRKEKFHERKPSSSSSSGKSTSSIPVSIPSANERQINVKLRESAAQRRERRKGNREDAPHSSSGNWSASSESGRASIGSENTTTTHPPRSTTTASIGTSSTSLSHVRRPKGRDTSASSSVTSEGTLTPDIIHDITAVPFSDDGENSSVYSCDTEGYYTSFHVDSGLKTLREEESLPQTPLVKSSDIGPDPTSPIAENEYELFGRGSTSTTTSSAGTVCTTLLAPPPPERKSSLTVVAMVHGQNQNGGQSPDSGHNTSSSPVESASSPACTGRSCSEFEYSESSDLEGCERVERIRSKTAINASRIPSMCVITPPGSDDETGGKDSGDVFRSRLELGAQGSAVVLMSATVGTSKMEVINGEDKNPYATVRTVIPLQEKTDNLQRRNLGSGGTASASGASKTSPLSGVLGKIRGVLPGGKKPQVTKSASVSEPQNPGDSGDYVTIADVRNNNNKRSEHVSTNAVARSSQPATYANQTEILKKDAEYVSLSELPKKQDSSLERRRHGARVTLDSDGKVVYSSDSLKRRKGAHTTFNPGPFVKEEPSPGASPLLHRAQATVRAVTRDRHISGIDTTDYPGCRSTPPTSPQLGKLIIRAPKSPERASSPNYVRTPSTVVRATSPTSPAKQVRGAYVNVQGEEDSALLAVPKESVPASPQLSQSGDGTIKKPPPPYIEPPQLKHHRNDNNVINNKRTSFDPCPGLYVKPSTVYRLNDHDIENRRSDNRGMGLPECYKNENLMRSGGYSQRGVYDDGTMGNNEYRRNDEDYSRLRRRCDYDDDRKGRNLENNEQFYTLPNYRSPRVKLEPPRSVTPDITRGLARGPAIKSIHVTARRGQNFSNDGQTSSSSRNTKTNVDDFCKRERDQQRCQEQNNPPLKNRLIVPASLAAVGYRFVAPAPAPSYHQELPGLKQATLSPIGPSGNRSFQSSTPGSRQNFSNQSNCQTINSAGRNPPGTNFLLSPTRSTMSNEELFAAIHKSKRRLNIREDSDGGISHHETNNQNQANSRHSWSPESQKTPVIPKSAAPQLPSTSRLDFKRLLLQQSVKTGPTKLSAAEQLKLSRQQSQQQQNQHHHHQQQVLQHQITPAVTPVKVLSPRAVWRFQSPRSDVLSSTIIEDAAAEEKAMKPSPENPSPISRLNSRRQLDLLGGDRENKKEEEEEEEEDEEGENILPENRDYDDRLLIKNNVPNNQSINDNYLTTKNNNNSSRGKLSSTAETFQDRDALGSTDDDNNEMNKIEDGEDKLKVVVDTRFNISNIINNPTTISINEAAEKRRLNNQLARAKFLASFPSTVVPPSSPSPTPSASTSYRDEKLTVNNYSSKMNNRARSESPNNLIANNVSSQNTSAPTLETAL